MLRDTHFSCETYAECSSYRKFRVNLDNLKINEKIFEQQVPFQTVTADGENNGILQLCKQNTKHGTIVNLCLLDVTDGEIHNYQIPV
jgi:hypothetical protein